MAEMPARELLICQRVSRKFRDIFQRSTDFKQRLHLKPSANEQVTLMPVLPSFVEHIEADVADRPPETTIELRFVDKLDLPEYLNASWCKMFVTSPPVTRISVDYMYSTMEGPDCCGGTGVHKKEGFTMGDLAKIVDELQDHNEGQWFEVTLHKEFILDL